MLTAANRWIFPVALIFGALASLLLPSCVRHDRSHPLFNDAYVWQRSWNDSLITAFTESASAIEVWRVLAAEADTKVDLTIIPIDLRFLRQFGKPVIAVIRIDGRSSTTVLDDKLAGEALALVSNWQRAGVPVRGLEIDYDCARSRLGGYRNFLHRLRARLPHDFRLSITALPSWIESNDLPNLLSEVDETVLQVHSVLSPSKGLFDRSTAYGWAHAWSALSSVPFRIALPTYWSRVSWTADGRVEAIESEVDRFGTATPGRELVVQPGDVASLLAELRQSPPRHLTGIAWFRLPTALDRRAWSLRTWLAVMQGRSLRRAPPVVRFKTDQTGSQDVYLRNEGDLDARLPPRISISAQGCEFSDAVPPYDVERETNMVRFLLKGDGLLRAGEQLLIGWVRCSNDRLDTHVTF